MSREPLGRLYRDGEEIIRQGETGDCMYVIEEGRAHVVVEQDGAEFLIRTAGPDDIVGEMALFENVTRCATVRASGDVRAITIDKETLLRQFHEDPSLAFRIVQTMSRRVRELTLQVAQLMRDS